MALINLQTDLTSLSFGHDRPGGGSSNQPYIQTEIPENLPVHSPDFLWRNGFLAPVSAAKDTSRLTQMFFDLKSPNGLLFTAKANLLSRISVKTQATIGAGYAGGTINQGVYTPTSTIAQALVGFTGTHLNLLGLDPSSPMSGVVEGGLFPGGGLNRYESVVKGNPNNRLIDLFSFQQEQESDNVVNILSYSGGPNSIVGVGETHIKFADQRTGINNREGKNFSTYQVNQPGYDPSTLPKTYESTVQESDDKLVELYDENIPKISTNPSEFADQRTGINNREGKNFATYQVNQPGYDPSSLPETYEDTIKESDDKLVELYDENIPKISSDPSEFADQRTGINNREGKNFATYQVNQPGYNPSSLPKTYESTVKKDDKLVELYDENIPKISSDPSEFADQRTGINNREGKNFSTYQVGVPLYSLSTLPKFYSPLEDTGTFNNTVGVSIIYTKKVSGQKESIMPVSQLSNGADGKFGRKFKTSVYGAFPAVTNRVKDNNSLTWTQKQITKVPDKNSTQGYADPTLDDFREPLLKGKKSSTIMSLAPSYKSSSTPKTIDGKSTSRINYVSPGQKGNIINYAKGKRDLITGRSMGPVDKINAEPIYQSFNVTDNTVKNDLIKFRIAAINNTPESTQFQKQFIHFRAYIDSFQDSYNGSWDSVNYMGRGESFYKYNNFKRSISLAFTVAAQSKEELIPMYKKLNFLASNLAPTYSKEGYMAGSLVELTMGGWCVDLPGFITSMTLDVPQESPWEIGINETAGTDSSVKELPHIVKVSGFAFTPIEKFRPAKQVNEFDSNGKLTGYGDERYIALEANGGNNYDNL